MTPRERPSILRLAALVPLMVLVAAGCDASPAAPDAALESAVVGDHAAHAAHSAHPGRAPVRAHGDLLKAVRQQTSRFSSLQQAERAGYQVDPHCVEVPGLGAMGHHAVNEAAIDPVFDPMQPEALLYMPNEGGAFKLVGVEYIVIDVGQDHPTFAGHLFDVGGVPPLMAQGVPHYSLHVWSHVENPAGTFVPFNAALTCG